MTALAPEDSGGVLEGAVFGAGARAGSVDPELLLSVPWALALPSAAACPALQPVRSAAPVAEPAS